MNATADRIRFVRERLAREIARGGDMATIQRLTALLDQLLNGTRSLPDVQQPAQR